MKNRIITRSAGIGNDTFPVLELAEHMESYGIDVFSITLLPNQTWVVWGKVTEEDLAYFFEHEGEGPNQPDIQGEE